MGHELILEVLSVLAVATAAIALCLRLGLSPILGYLAAGMIVGPHGFGWIPGPGHTQAFAELGVVLLMFTVGLEFPWSRLMAAKRLVLGLGGTQVVLTTLLFGAAIWSLGESLLVATIAAAAMAMSSTAIVLKHLSEQAELSTPYGRAAFCILLFQDLVALAYLVALPIFATDQTPQLLSIALVWALFKTGLLLASLTITGHRFLPPLLHWVAAARSQEFFMATTLVMALAAAGLSIFLGLSATLGAFMAGTLLGETLFRHQIEADIRPFRDLMLGVFFITIGMQLDLTALISSPTSVVLTLAALLVVKTVLMAPIIRLFGQPPITAWRTAIILAQGGEFGLLLVSLSLGLGLIGNNIGQSLLLGLVLSMLAAPLLLRFSKALGTWLAGRSGKKRSTATEQQIASTSADLDRHVILCGYGRMGQILARLLEQEGIPALALDLDLERVKQVTATGGRVLYGDAARPGILHAAEIGRARALVITFADAAGAERVVAHARQARADLPILVRSQHGTANVSLSAAGAEVFPEGLESSLAFAGQLLILLGMPTAKVEARLNAIRAQDYAPLDISLLEGEQAEQIRTVAIDDSYHAVGRTLAEVGLPQPEVQLKAVRRGSLRLPAWQLDFRLRAGDVLVLQGLPVAIDQALVRLAQGADENGIKP